MSKIQNLLWIEGTKEATSKFSQFMMPRKFLSTFTIKLSSEPLWWSHLHGPSLTWRACLEGHPTDKKHRFLEVFRTPNITCCASEPSVPTGQNHGKLHQQQRNKTRNSTAIGNPFAKSEPGGGPPAGTIIGGLEWRSKNQENRGPCWRQDPVMCVTFPLQSKALQLCKWHFFKPQQRPNLGFQCKPWRPFCIGFQALVKPFALAQWGVEYLFSTGWHIKESPCLRQNESCKPNMDSWKTWQHPKSQRHQLCFKYI